MSSEHATGHGERRTAAAFGFAFGMAQICHTHHLQTTSK
jgi:hypothetical protein